MMEKILKESEIFKHCSDEQLKEIIAISFTKKFKDKDPVFFQGDKAESLCIVKSGKVKIFKMSGEGKEQVLHIFPAGEPFGEVALFAGKNFPANSEAIGDSEIIYIPRKNLINMFASDPLIPMNIIAVLSIRLKQFTNLIEDLSLKELPERLASYIIQQEISQGQTKKIVLEFSKGQLSKILGTTQESLSRTLTKLSKAEIIDINKREITIKDMEILKEISTGITNIKDLI